MESSTNDSQRETSSPDTAPTYQPSTFVKGPQMAPDGLLKQKKVYQAFPEWLSEKDTQSRLVERDGVSGATLLENDIHHPSLQELREIFGFYAPGFIIPYFDLDRKPVIDEGLHKPEHKICHKGRIYVRIRFDKPRDMKYLQAKETTSHLYFPNGLQECDCSEIVIVEGEMKALSLMEEGIPAIGIGGFYGIAKDHAINPELTEAIERLGIQKIFFLGDSDTAHNYQFAHAATKLAEWVDPIPVRLPRIALDNPKGIDDIKAHLGQTAFLEYWLRICADSISVNSDYTPASLCLDLIERELPIVSALPSGEEHKILFRRLAFAASYLYGASILDRFFDLSERAGFNIETMAKARELMMTFKDFANIKEANAAKSKVESLYDGKHDPEAGKRKSMGATATKPKSSKKSSTPPKPKAKDFIFLPSAFTTTPNSALQIFERLGRTEKFYRRHGAIAFLDYDERNVPFLDVVTSDKMRGRLANYGTLARWRLVQGTRMAAPGALPTTMEMNAILGAEETRLLPLISAIHNSPIIVRNDKGGLQTLGKGYHKEAEGRFVMHGEVEEVPLADAIKNINELFDEFDFENPSDKSRAIAALITPAVAFGELIKFHWPLFIIEADKSQSGKGFLAELIQKVYGEIPSMVPQTKKKGPSSTDEFLQKALIYGRPFIQLDNFKGSLDSEYLEIVLTCPPEATVGARVAFSPEIKIRPSRFVFQLTSNGFVTTPDLANRSCLIRILNRPGHDFKTYPEGELLDHIKANQSRFLGSVFSVIKEWHHRGEPFTNDLRPMGRFRRWWQTFDWIVQNIFNLPPLFDDHQQAKKRLSNNHLSWLRRLDIAVEESGKMGEDFLSTDVADLCESKNIYPETASGKVEMSAMTAGKLLSAVFGNKTMLDIGSFMITVRHEKVARKEKGDFIEKKFYQFRLSSASAPMVPSITGEMPSSTVDPSIPTDPSDKMEKSEEMQSIEESFEPLAGVDGNEEPYRGMYYEEVTEALLTWSSGKLPDIVLEAVRYLCYGGMEPGYIHLFAQSEGIPPEITEKAVTILEYTDQIGIKNVNGTPNYYPMTNGKFELGYPGQPLPDEEVEIEDEFLDDWHSLENWKAIMGVGKGSGSPDDEIPF